MRSLPTAIPLVFLSSHGAFFSSVSAVVSFFLIILFLAGQKRRRRKVTSLSRASARAQCLATCKSLVNREKNLFAGHFRGNFLRSRAWRKLCDCPTARN